MKKCALGVLFAVVFAAVFVTGCDDARNPLKGTVEVPDLVKSTEENARIALENRNLRIVIVDKIESDEVEKDLICKQDPLRGSVIKKGSEVRVWISTGSSQVEIPRLENASFNDALRRLVELELNPTVEFVYAQGVEKDMVISLDPMPGTRVDKESYVKVQVSKGEEPVSTVVVPKVTGLSKRSAETKLTELGLVPKFVYRVSTEYYEGTLYYQTPKSGSVVPLGSTVTVTVATVLD